MLNHNMENDNNENIKKWKWKSLQHNGVAFPPKYQSKGLKICINNQVLYLNNEQEELIYAWAKKKDTHYVHDVIFQSNFLIDLKQILPEKFQDIQSIKEIDFTDVYKLVDNEQYQKLKEKERLKNLSREEKKKIQIEKKEEKEKLKKIYGIAIVDGIEVEVANWLVEPPGLFMGRGLHPLRGRWKPRVLESDVILNLGETASVPEGPWAKIVHDHSSTWLATWNEKLTDKRKYVWLHDSSSLRQNKDKEKYDKAKNLEKHILKVEKEVLKRMRTAKDINQKKIATVCYLILKLAMRVGDEKDPDEADTVGATTLRIEHIKFPTVDGHKSIEFNFLGKDSVPWQKQLQVNTDEDHILYDNLRQFMKDKNQADQIFDNINSSKVNNFLRSIDPRNVPGLTAKVFRTYIATNIVKKSLINPNLKIDKNSSEWEKMYVAKIANLNAAITCNHKKGIDPRNPASKKTLERFEEGIRKKEETIGKLKNSISKKEWKTETQKRRLYEKLEKVVFQLKLQKETRDYNLGTSLRNYIDPRVMKSWLDYVDLDWKKIYTTTLQRKFKWIESTDTKEFFLK